MASSAVSHSGPAQATGARKRETTPLGSDTHVTVCAWCWDTVGTLGSFAHISVGPEAGVRAELAFSVEPTDRFPPRIHVRTPSPPPCLMPSLGIPPIGRVLAQLCPDIHHSYIQRQPLVLKKHVALRQTLAKLLVETCVSINLHPGRWLFWPRWQAGPEV